ncbi:MAG: imelysin family protein [Bacteroidota bacterium]
MKPTTFLPHILALLLAAGLLFITGCDDDSDDDEPTSTEFDRAVMLANYADNLIVPAYETSISKASDLATAINTFLANPTAQTLPAAQTAWTEAYSAWQSTSAYNFGPAENSFGTLLEDIGTYPVDANLTEAYIAAGDTSFGNFDRDTRGYLTAEYLLFSTDAATQLAQSANRRAYLRSVVRNIVESLSGTRSGWDSYRAEFVASVGTDAGSSTAVLYNEFVKNFEAVKNFKVGLPLGKRPGQTQTEPQNVEALYSGQSKEMFKLNFASVERIYKGESEGTTGPGLADFLRSVVGGEDLYNATLAQIEVVKKAEQALPANQTWRELVESNSTEADTYHTELQRLTRFFKSDMSSLLGIAITFDSGDGD